MYALTETTITEIKSVVAPVISNIRTIPVIGALRTAEIYPAIPSIIKLLKKLISKITFFIIKYPNTLPITAPMIKDGKKIPPGVSDPKHIKEKTYFINKATNKNLIVEVELKYSTILNPLPIAIGNKSPTNPATINGIIGFVLMLKKSNRL